MTRGELIGRLDLFSFTHVLQSGAKVFGRGAVNFNWSAMIPVETRSGSHAGQPVHMSSFLVLVPGKLEL